MTTASATSAPTGALTNSSSESALAPVFNNPAYATISIKSHVPITLELKCPNYTRWSAFFLSLCGKFGLRSHIDGTAALCPDDPAWAATDS
jgi:hypothetical protein